MSIDVHDFVADRMVVVYDPDLDEGEDLYMLAAINEYLWRNFRLALDCEYLEIHLVYGHDVGEERPKGAPQADEN